MQQKAEDCNYCRNVSLKELKYPAHKVTDLYFQEFVQLKHKKLLETFQDQEQDDRIEYLQSVATEVEKREVINRKVFQLRLQTVYGRDENEKLDFNCVS